MGSTDSFCRSCGSSIETNDQFCRKCGEDLSKHTPLDQDHETEPVAPVETSSPIDWRDNVSYEMKHFYYRNKLVCLGVLATLIAVPMVFLLFTQTPKIPIALACEAYMVLQEKTQEYVRVNNYEMAIEPSTEAINLIESYDKSELQQFCEGTWQKATNRINIRPVVAYYNRGFIYDELGEYQKAIKDYDEAIRLDPQYVNAYNNRGVAYKKLGQYQKAIKDYDEAIRLDPSEAIAYYNRGLAYRKLGRSVEAERDIAKAKELGYTP